MLIARARLLKSMRAVKVTWECQFERMFNMSCRKNATLHDPRLPGGQATGKVTEYHIKGDGATGQLVGVIQIECCVGTGVTVTAVAGTPDYCEAAYVGSDYQFYSGATVLLPTNDIGFTVPASTGTSIPTGVGAVVKNVLHIEEPLTVGQVLAEGGGDQLRQSGKDDTSSPGASFFNPATIPSDPGVALSEGLLASLVSFPTWYELELTPCAGFSFEVQYDLALTPVMGPKMIDLSAASTP
jgi:hypothetical protein